MAEETNGQRVSYSVKELISTQTNLIERIDIKLDGVVNQLDQKANATDLADLRARVDVLDASTVKREGPLMTDMRVYERNLDTLTAKFETLKVTQDNAKTTTRWWINGPVTAAISASVAVVSILTSHLWR